MMRSLLLVLLLWTCVSQVVVLGAAAAPPRYNVLYIVVDDLRLDISPYRVRNAAAAQTPNFERLAATGTLFEHAYVQQAVCGPSRNSFLSGRRPDATAVWNFIDDFRGFCMGSYETECEGFGGNETWSSLPQHFRRQLAPGEYVIKRRFQSKRAQIYIRLQLFPSTFR
jgi:hypothetical protein